MAVETSNVQIPINGKENSNLFDLIPIIYGAVFSYSMYVFSIIIVQSYQEWKPLNINNILHGDSFKKIILFSGFTLYMIEDVGSTIKLNNKYPFLKTSRYTFEIFIAMFYICSYSLLEEGIYLCVACFGIVFLLSAIWHNQFKEEYKNINDSVTTYAKSERDLHYFGAFVFLIEAGFFIARHENEIYWVNVITFICTLVIWMIVSAKWVSTKHGEKVLECKVMVLLSETSVRKNSKTFILKD